MSEKNLDLRLVDLIGKVVEGVRLTTTESEAAFDRFMDGSASEVEMAGLLAALRTKGAKHTEIAGVYVRSVKPWYLYFHRNLKD